MSRLVAASNWRTRRRSHAFLAPAAANKPSGSVSAVHESLPPRTLSHTLTLTQCSRSSQCRQSGLGEARQERRRKETRKSESSVGRLALGCRQRDNPRGGRRHEDGRLRAWTVLLENRGRESAWQAASRSAACVSSSSVCAQRDASKAVCSIQVSWGPRERESYQVHDAMPWSDMGLDVETPHTEAQNRTSPRNKEAARAQSTEHN